MTHQRQQAGTKGLLVRLQTSALKARPDPGDQLFTKIIIIVML